LQLRSANLVRLLALAVSISAHALLLAPLTHRLSAPSTGKQRTELTVEWLAAADNPAPPAPPPRIEPPAAQKAETRQPATASPVVDTAVRPDATAPVPPPDPPRPPSRAAPQPRPSQDAAASSSRDHYLTSVLRAIEARKRYPTAARRRRLEGQVRVSFRLGRDGAVTGLKCAGGHPWLCRAATQAVAAAAPLPPLPPGLLGQAPLTVQFRMDYVLH
jgi:protein TonB